METEQIRKIILKELPQVMKTDPAVQRLILDLSRKYFAGKVETENRIDLMIDELRKDREAREKRWAPHGGSGPRGRSGVLSRVF